MDASDIAVQVLWLYSSYIEFILHFVSIVREEAGNACLQLVDSCASCPGRCCLMSKGRHHQEPGSKCEGIVKRLSEVL